MQRSIYSGDHEQFRSSFRQFLEREAVPIARGGSTTASWIATCSCAAGDHGFLAIDAPERFGGGGVADFRFNAVIAEEIQQAGMNAMGLGLTLHNDICLPYFLTLANEEVRRGKCRCAA